MSETAPTEYSPLSYFRVMCPNCYFVLDEGVEPLIVDICPHCNSHVELEYLFGLGQPHIFDMIEYFNQRGIATDDESVAQISSSLQKHVGISIDREGLIQTVRAAQEVYEKLDPTGQWSEYFYDDVIYTVQKVLALPERTQAVKVWDILGNYSATTHDHKMVIVLVNMLLEQLLDGRLIVLAITHDELDRTGAESLVYDRLRSMPKKLRFFVERLPHIPTSGKLSPEQVKAEFCGAFAMCAPANFYPDWDTIRDIRNRFVHQDAWAIELVDVQRALRLAHQAIPVFAEIQNRYCLKDQTSP